MKTLFNPLTLSVLLLGFTIVGCSKKESHVFSSLKDPATVAQLKQFVAEKKLQAEISTNEPAPEFAPFFAAAEKGDWLAVSNAFEDLHKHAAQYQGSAKNTDPRLHGPRWEAVKEIWGTFYAFSHGDEKYSAAFGNDIIQSIPPGSIYFGGTDPGRFLVTGMEKSQVNGDPFFILTQNALADPTYLEYARSLYGESLYIPTGEDSQRCFQDYLDDAQKRLAKHQLKPGEDVHTDASGHVQVAGQVAVMDINARLVKVIFDHNTNHEFYIEESFPLDWMYPNLEPHGLVMKINREPVGDLSADILQADHDYWAQYTTPIIGDWLNSDTTVQQVVDFAEKTYVKHDLNGFKGDPRFVASSDSQEMFSKLRSSIAGVYAWRLVASQTVEPAPAEYAPKSDASRRQLQRETELAFEQAFALCPYLPETVFRYATFLVAQGRKSDAVLLAQTAAHVEPKNQQFTQLVRSLSR